MADNRNPGQGLFRGLILVVVGCVLIGIGMSLGGQWAVRQWWPFPGTVFAPTFGPIHFGSDDDNRDLRIVDTSGEFSEGLTELDLDLGAASLVIRKGTVAGWKATGFAENSLKATASGTRFSARETDWIRGFRFGDEFPKPTLEITLTGTEDLSECAIQVGAGSVLIEGLDTDRFDCESGAGSIKGTDIHANDAELSTGAGSLELEGMRVDTLRIETGAGRIVYSGEIGQKAEISTGAGSVELTLPGSESDYRFDYERGIGSVRIGGESFSGAGNGSAGNREASKKIKLSTGVGSVRVSFSGE